MADVTRSCAAGGFPGTARPGRTPRWHLCTGTYAYLTKITKPFGNLSRVKMCQASQGHTDRGVQGPGAGPGKAPGSSGTFLARPSPYAHIAVCNPTPDYLIYGIQDLHSSHWNYHRHSQAGRAAPAARSAAMDDEPAARDQIRKALRQARHSNPQITSVYDFIELVRDAYFSPRDYKTYRSIAIEMWNDYRNALPPTPPADSNVRPSSDSEGSDVPRDTSNRLPVLDPESEPDTLFIMPQTPNSKVAYASYKQGSTPGSYIRADAVRDKSLEAREDGLVEVQWKLVEGRRLSANRRIPHTAFRVVDEEEAESMNMDVDLVLGTDCQNELQLQVLVAEACRASERLARAVEREKPQTLMMPAGGGPSSTQMPCTAWSEASPAPTSLLHNDLGPVIVLPWVSNARALSGLLEATRHPAATRRAAASGMAGFGPPVVTALNDPKTSEGSQTKRKATDDHESRFRDRPEMFRD
ncbi:hypothetical protein BJ166DRAFT_496369 [Pestalotiopsis sp. NC0098]|nr:hypothetical protein BJ166DRAFT_496369 [Pestalotiopsis sp. NC0098]